MKIFAAEVYQFRSILIIKVHDVPRGTFACFCIVSIVSIINYLQQNKKNHDLSNKDNQDKRQGICFYC